MERSNFDKFMDCLQPLEQLTMRMIVGLVLWEKIQQCEKAGLPMSSIDWEQAALEAETRYQKIHSDLYIKALCEWAIRGHSEQTTEHNDEAAEI